VNHAYACGLADSAGARLVAVISPGANFVITLHNSIGFGRQAGVYTAVSLAAGNLVYTTYCLVGIGVIYFSLGPPAQHHQMDGDCLINLHRH
jgi:threonine/homoserine/homoserine lactone efflux protein